MDKPLNFINGKPPIEGLLFLCLIIMTFFGIGISIVVFAPRIQHWLEKSSMTMAKIFGKFVGLTGDEFHEQYRKSFPFFVNKTISLWQLRVIGSIIVIASFVTFGFMIAVWISNS